MSKRTIVITGASSGIGEAAATALAAQGAHIVVVGRNRERTRAVAERVNGDALFADYFHLDDVHLLAETVLRRYGRIDVLANNAGGISRRRALTVDGNEHTFQSNHLAPFLLTSLLLPRLVESAKDAPVRVVSTSSRANLWGRLRLDDLDWSARAWLGGWRAYGTSKLATIYFVNVLAERMTGTGVSAYSFHPGVVNSRFWANAAGSGALGLATGGRFGIGVEEGAAPLIALAGDFPVEAPSGTYFDRFRANGKINSQARNPQLGRDLWGVSEQLVGLTSAPTPP